MFDRFSDVYKSNKLVNSFQDILENIFLPLFEVTNDPSSHPDLHAFLQYVSINLVAVGAGRIWMVYAFGILIVPSELTFFQILVTLIETASGISTFSISTLGISTSGISTFAVYYIFSKSALLRYWF